MTQNTRYPIPKTTHRVEEEILRSRFITTVAHADTLEAARDFVDVLRAEFADATHNCWAYLIGPPGNTGQLAYSDDGEPHGTAGKPMATVLQHSGIGDLAAVVTRYFGGTLLGKGGLVRAYSGGVKLALASLPLSQRIITADVIVVIDYPYVTPVQRLLPTFEVELLAEEYAAEATFRLRLPAERVTDLEQALIGLTNGQVVVDSLPPQGE